MKASTILLTAAALAMTGASAIRAQTEPATTTTTTTTTTEPAPKKYIDVGGPALGQSASTKSKIICRRDAEIGSLVKGIRRCGTAEEWRRSADAARSTTMTIQDQKGAFTAP